MSNIRLFFKESLSLNLTAKLEKSPSGPIITQVGLLVNFFKSNFLFLEFKSVNIKSTFLFFKKDLCD